MADGKTNDRMLITALKSNPTVLSLCNKNLYQVPHLIGCLKNLKSLLLKSNHLKDLPNDIASLQKLEVINIGNNELEKLPNVFRYTNSLKKLHLFNNLLDFLDPVCLQGLCNLRLLNLNNNKLEHIPEEINRLPYLEVLSLDNNRLSEIPVEVCQLTQLEELRINCNTLKCLPADISFLRKLKVLHVRKNLLEELPDGIRQCTKLKILDVSANAIRTFPSGLLDLHLEEFYCEENDLLTHQPVKSIQEQEVFTLKEIAVRAVINMMESSNSILRNQIKYYPDVQGILKMALNCFVCGGPFLNTWLECVQFVHMKKFLKTKANTGDIPIRGMLCSYHCFNTNEHESYGIACGEVQMIPKISKP